MKTKNIILATLVVASISLTSCSEHSYIYSFGIEQAVYVDYEEIQQRGIEVTENDIPKDATMLGRLSYIVRFPRVYKKTKTEETKDSYDMAIPTSNYSYTKIGNLDEDIKRIPKIIADLVKKKWQRNS